MVQQLAANVGLAFLYGTPAAGIRLAGDRPRHSYDQA